MSQKSSDTYKSLPGAIASTIPRRVSFRESWRREQPPVAESTRCPRKIREYKPLKGKTNNETSNDMYLNSVKRKSLLFQTDNQKKSIIESEVSEKEFKENPHYGRGHVKKFAELFEKNHNNFESRSLARQKPTKSLDDSNYTDVIKYQVKTPFWNDYNKPKARASRHTVSNFPKWDTICQAQLQSSLQNQKEQIETERCEKLNKVNSIKSKILNTSKDTDNGKFKNIERSHNIPTSLSSKKKSMPEKLSRPCIMISDPVLINTSKLSVKPLIKPRSFKMHEISRSSSEPQHIERSPAMLTELLPGKQHDNNSNNNNVATASGVRCVVAGAYATPVLSDRSDVVQATSSHELVNDSLEKQFCERQYADADLDAVDSDTSVCTVISAVKRKNLGSDKYSRSNEIMVTKGGVQPVLNKVMGASDLKRELEFKRASSSGDACSVSSKSNTPRIVAASLKSYKDIPEELFNSLQESSVDPVPNGDLSISAEQSLDVELKEQDWVVMQEGRRALLETSVLSNNWLADGDSLSDGRASSLSTSSDHNNGSLKSRGSTMQDFPASSPAAAIKNHFRGFCSTMIEDSDTSSANTSIEKPVTHHHFSMDASLRATRKSDALHARVVETSSGRGSFLNAHNSARYAEGSQSFSNIDDSRVSYSDVSIDSNITADIEEENLSDTERKLRENGVYFRLPIPSSRRIKEYDSSSWLNTSKSSQGEMQNCVNADELFHNDSEAEVAAVLERLDTTLANYSSSGSSNCSNHSSESSPGSVIHEAVNPAGLEANSAGVVVQCTRQCDRSSGPDNTFRSSDYRNTCTNTENKGKNIRSLTCRNVQYKTDSHDSRNEIDSNRSREVPELTITKKASVMSVKCLTENYENAAIRSSDSNPVVTICSYSERGRLGPFKLDKENDDLHMKNKTVCVLKNNLKNSVSHDRKINRDSIMEPLNLIEEVYVPESSVAIRAFFPGVEHPGRGMASLSKSQVKNSESDKSDRILGRCGDSDSGHGSGATSPCGTLTDPPSPPPSPPDSRHSHLQAQTVQKISPIIAHTSERQREPASSVVSNTQAPSTVSDQNHVSILTCSPVVTSNTSTLSEASSTISAHSSSSQQTVVGLESAVVSACEVGSGEVTVTTSQSKESSHFVVVAIDFGTTYSGYAFSFTGDPESVHMMKKWEGGDPGVQNQKTPTIVLLTPDRKFHSLGFTARDHYHDLDPKVTPNWLYFDKFKMTLHDDRSLSRDSYLQAANGEQVPALEIFSHALGYFRDHALRELSDLAGGGFVSEEDVRWVITVPAIWSHPAKQFMRTAAYMAGLGSVERPEQLLIALEPEAAAIYCRKLHRHQLVPARPPVLRAHNTVTTKDGTSSSHSGTYSKNPRQQSLPPESIDTHVSDSLANLSSASSTLKSLRPYSTLDGSFPTCRDFRVVSRLNGENVEVPRIEQDGEQVRPLSSSETVSDWLVQDTVYMVVDCGGGTVDITVHQMTDTKAGHLKELHKATGGPYGSTGVDKEFRRLLNQIFTEDFMKAFKQQRPAAFVDLMIAFESRKRNASLYRSNPLNIALPFSFIDMYKKTKGKDVESAIKKHGGALGVQWSSQGMLRVSQETMRGLFSNTLTNIQQSIESVVSLLEREASNGNSTALQYLFLVGGFSESELLQQHIRDAFSHRVTVIIPQGMGLAILRGAVQFGLDPSVVTVRRSRLTYGVGVLNRYQEGVHPQEKRVFAAGADWCADVLDVFVRVDESVAVGDVVSRSYTPATVRQSTVVLHLYATHDTKAMHFVSDHGVQRVGTLHLDLRNTWSDSYSDTHSKGNCCDNKCCSTSTHNSQPQAAASLHNAGEQDRELVCISKTGTSCDRLDNEGVGERSSSGGAAGSRGCSCSAGTCSSMSSHTSKNTCRSSNCCGIDGEQRREISVHLKFGDTEVKASAVDHQTGKCVKVNFDFLSL